MQNHTVLFDKNGEYHYDNISAMIKSMRGSDPNAAVLYLARALSAGEDIEFLARRIMICAAEDVGLANPNALLIAVSAYQCAQSCGMPEARIPAGSGPHYGRFIAKIQCCLSCDRQGSLMMSNVLIPALFRCTFAMHRPREWRTSIFRGISIRTIIPDT